MVTERFLFYFFEINRTWFLNAYWKKEIVFEDLVEDVESGPEVVWSYFRQCCELDERGEEGNELEQIKAHQVLQNLGRTKTHNDFLAELSTLDIDQNGKVSLTEFLCLHYGVDWRGLGMCDVLSNQVKWFWFARQRGRAGCFSSYGEYIYRSVVVFVVFIWDYMYVCCGCCSIKIRYMSVAPRVTGCRYL